MFVPRLRRLALSHGAASCLGIKTRGAITNLTVMPQRHVPQHLGGREVELRVRAVGLNFRDVLNVLGEYPGDPGPPGLDCSGQLTGAGCDATHLRVDGVSGFAFGSLATLIQTSAGLVVSKSSALTHEQASSLPITFSTVHTAYQGAHLRFNPIPA